MSMKRPTLPRWFWPLLAAGCVLVLLLEVLLRRASSGDPGIETGAAGAGLRGRAPFPRAGEFSGVPRPPEVERREKSAPDPWQQWRKGK